MSLLYLAIAGVFGVYLGSTLPLASPFLWFLLALVPPLALLLGRRGLFPGLCLAFVLLGMLRFQATLPTLAEQTLAYHNSQSVVEVTGLVAADPELRDNYTELRLSATRLRLGQETREVSGPLLVRARAPLSLVQRRSPPYFRYGDVLRLKGRLEEPPAPAGFNYRDYLARQGIHSLMSFPQIELVASCQGFKPWEVLYSLRHRLSAALGHALPEPQAALAQGILLGQRAAIPQELKDAFARTGTTHILAISGHNLSVVAGLLTVLAGWIWGRRRPWVILSLLLALWGYALLVGMAPSVVRAAIMGSLVLLAAYFGREESAPTSLALAAWVMIWLHPQVLWDIGFQLSFLAMAGLIYVAPPLQALGRRFLQPEGGPRAAWLQGLWDMFSVTLGATLATLPVIAFNFHRIPLIGLPATTLGLPALPGIIATTAVTSGLGLFSPLLAQGVGWFAWLWLTWLMGVAELGSRLPFASLETGPLPLVAVAGYYALLGLIVGWPPLTKAVARWSTRVSPSLDHLEVRAVALLGSSLPTKGTFLALSMAALLVWAAALIPREERLRVTFFDVGQGQAILVETPGQHRILIDGGPSPQALPLALGKKLPFWERQLDLIILTHPHQDHLAGLPPLLRRYAVTQVLEGSAQENSAVYEEWKQALREHQAKVKRAQGDERFALGKGAWLEVLTLPEGALPARPKEADNRALVLRLTYGAVNFLFTSDIGEPAETWLLSRRVDLASTVLQVGHHGAATSTTAEFLAAVAPQVAVISVGADNPFGHPSPEVLSRLKERVGEDRTYLTSDRGTVELMTDGVRLWVRAARPKS